MESNQTFNSVSFAEVRGAKNMKQQKLTRSQFDARNASGKWNVEKVLAAVEETRKKYRRQILDARKPVR